MPKGQPYLREDDRRAGRKRASRNYYLSHKEEIQGKREVRGLLCDNCNQALGKFRDDPALLRKAAAYVERFQRIEIR